MRAAGVALTQQVVPAARWAVWLIASRHRKLADYRRMRSRLRRCRPQMGDVTYAYSDVTPACVVQLHE